MAGSPRGRPRSDDVRRHHAPIRFASRGAVVDAIGRCLAGPHPRHAPPVVDLHFQVVLISDLDGGAGMYALTFTGRPELVDAWQ